MCVCWALLITVYCCHWLRCNWWKCSIVFVYYFFLFSDHLCICTYKFVVVYLHAVIFITAIISGLQGRQFLLQPQSRQQFFASIFFVWLRAIMCYNNVCLGHSCWLNILLISINIAKDFLKYFKATKNIPCTLRMKWKPRLVYKINVRLILVHLKVKYKAGEEQK